MQQILVGTGLSILPPPDSVSFSILSGGGSGNRSGANCSGGAGAIPIEGTFVPTGGSSYAVTVGAGGTSSNSGQQSSIAGVSNGSPGGGAGSCIQGGSNANYSGGTGTGFPDSGGGGAGASSNATPPISTFGGGGGGFGVVMALHPTGLRVGGGGSGGSFGTRTPGPAPDGGGLPNVAGAANRGGGGGNDAPGGSGRVILRYSDSFGEASTTGSVNTSQSGGFRTYDFISSGTITF